MAAPYKAPMSPPPYNHDGAPQNLSSPPPAHMMSPPPQGAGSDYYNASPYQQPGFAQSGYPPQGPPPGQYFEPNNGGYPQQGGYPPQGYYGQQGGYPQQGMYMQPQGQYVDDRGRGGGGKEGFLGACLGALACCCCLDLLF